MRENGTTICRPDSREISYFNVSVLICNSLEMGMVLPPTLKLRPIVNTQLVLYSHVCAPYTENDCQWLGREGPYLSYWSRYHHIGHDLYTTRIATK